MARQWRIAATSGTAASNWKLARSIQLYRQDEWQKPNVVWQRNFSNNTWYVSYPGDPVNKFLPTIRFSDTSPTTPVDVGYGVTIPADTRVTDGMILQARSFFTHWEPDDYRKPTDILFQWQNNTSDSTIEGWEDLVDPNDETNAKYKSNLLTIDTTAEELRGRLRCKITARNKVYINDDSEEVALGQTDVFTTTYVRVSTGVPVNIVPPKLLGEGKLGALLTTDPGTWTPEPSDYKFRYYKTRDADGLPDLLVTTINSPNYNFTIPNSSAYENEYVYVRVAASSDGVEYSNYTPALYISDESLEDSYVGPIIEAPLPPTNLIVATGQAADPSCNYYVSAGATASTGTFRLEFALIPEEDRFKPIEEQTLVKPVIITVTSVGQRGDALFCMVPENVTYYVRVRGRRGTTGAFQYSSAVYKIITVVGRPQPPTNVTVTVSRAAQQALISWTPGVGSDQTKIELYDLGTPLPKIPGSNYWYCTTSVNTFPLPQVACSYSRNVSNITSSGSGYSTACSQQDYPPCSFGALIDTVYVDNDTATTLTVALVGGKRYRARLYGHASETQVDSQDYVDTPNFSVEASAPNPPTNLRFVITGRQVEFLWDAPAIDADHSAATAYRVNIAAYQYSNNGNLLTNTGLNGIVTSETTSQTRTASGCLDVYWTGTVTATNSGGESSAISFTDPATVVGVGPAPSFASAISIGGYLRISFTAGSSVPVEVTTTRILNAVESTGPTYEFSSGNAGPFVAGQQATVDVGPLTQGQTYYAGVAHKSGTCRTSTAFTGLVTIGGAAPINTVPPSILVQTGAINLAPMVIVGYPGVWEPNTNIQAEYRWYVGTIGNWTSDGTGQEKTISGQSYNGKYSALEVRARVGSTGEWSEWVAAENYIGPYDFSETRYWYYSCVCSVCNGFSGSYTTRNYQFQQVSIGTEIGWPGPQRSCSEAGYSTTQCTSTSCSCNSALYTSSQLNSAVYPPYPAQGPEIAGCAQACAGGYGPVGFYTSCSAGYVVTYINNEKYCCPSNFCCAKSICDTQSGTYQSPPAFYGCYNENQSSDSYLSGSFWRELIVCTAGTYPPIEAAAQSACASVPVPVPIPIPVATTGFYCTTRDCGGGCNMYYSPTNTTGSGTCYSTICRSAAEFALYGYPAPCENVPVPVPTPVPIPVPVNAQCCNPPEISAECCPYGFQFNVNCTTTLGQPGKYSYCITPDGCDNYYTPCVATAVPVPVPTPIPVPVPVASQCCNPPQFTAACCPYGYAIDQPCTNNDLGYARPGRNSYCITPQGCADYVTDCVANEDGPVPVPIVGQPWNCKTVDCGGGCSTYSSATNQSASGTCYSTQCLQHPAFPSPCPGTVPVPVPTTVPVPTPVPVPVAENCNTCSPTQSYNYTTSDSNCPSGTRNWYLCWTPDGCANRYDDLGCAPSVPVPTTVPVPTGGLPDCPGTITNPVNYTCAELGCTDIGGSSQYAIPAGQRCCNCSGGNVPTPTPVTPTIPPIPIDFFVPEPFTPTTPQLPPPPSDAPAAFPYYYPDNPQPFPPFTLPTFPPFSIDYPSLPAIYESGGEPAPTPAPPQSSPVPPSAPQEQQDNYNPPSGGGGCIVGSTLVATPNGPVEAQHLRGGDVVYSVRFAELTTDETVYSLPLWSSESLTPVQMLTTVVQQVRVTRASMIQVSINGDRFTPEHPILVRRHTTYSFLSAGSVQVGDLVLRRGGDTVADLEWTPVMEKTVIDLPAIAYIFDTEEDDVLFTVGMLTHNLKM